MKKMSLMSVIIILLVAGISVSWGVTQKNQQGTFNVPNLTYVEHGVIYESNPAIQDDNSTRKRIDDIDQIVSDHSTSKVLFLKKNQEWKLGTEASGSFDLWLFDSALSKSYMVYKDVKDADISTSGDLIAAAVDYPSNEISIVTNKGELVSKVGVHGTSPLFSADGKLLAYYKLADYGEGQDLFFNAKGIALYSIETGKEILVTDNSEDFSPIAFSSDLKSLYFISGRPQADNPMNHIASLWVVSIDGKSSPVQLTNLDGLVMPPYFSKNALWSTDGKSVIDSDGSDVWLFSFTEANSPPTINRLSSGSSPKWIERDHVIAFRDGGKWHTLNINR